MVLNELYEVSRDMMKCRIGDVSDKSWNIWYNMLVYNPNVERIDLKLCRLDVVSCVGSQISNKLLCVRVKFNTLKSVKELESIFVGSVGIVDSRYDVRDTLSYYLDLEQQYLDGMYLEV